MTDTRLYQSEARAQANEAFDKKLYETLSSAISALKNMKDDNEGFLLEKTEIVSPIHEHVVESYYTRKDK